MKLKKDYRISWVSNEFIRLKENDKSHINNNLNIDIIEIEWNEKKKFEKNIFDEWESELIFSFFIKSFHILDNKIDIWIIENMNK